MTDDDLQSYKEIIEILLKHGANPDIQGVSKKTALHFATINEKKEIIKLLLDFGASATIENWGGETPFDDSSEEVLAILKEHESEKAAAAKFINPTQSFLLYKDVFKSQHSKLQTEVKGVKFKVNSEIISVRSMDAKFFDKEEPTKSAVVHRKNG